MPGAKAPFGAPNCREQFAGQSVRLLLVVKISCFTQANITGPATSFAGWQWWPKCSERIWCGDTPAPSKISRCRSGLPQGRLAVRGIIHRRGWPRIDVWQNHWRHTAINRWRVPRHGRLVRLPAGNAPKSVARQRESPCGRSSDQYPCQRQPSPRRFAGVHRRNPSALLGVAWPINRHDKPRHPVDGLAIVRRALHSACAFGNRQWRRHPVVGRVRL